MTQTNFAKSTVAMGYDALVTRIDLVPGGGAQFPTPPFNATWWNITDYPDPADDPNAEVIKVINIDGDTLDIVRAQEGTSASVKNIPGKTYALMIDLVPETGVEHTDIMGNLVPYVGATKDVDLGTNNLYTNNLYTKNNLYGMMLYLVNLGSVAFMDVYNNEVGEITMSPPYTIIFYNNLNNIQVNFDMGQLTTDQTFTIPDQSGTLALAENVVPYTGATADVNLGNNNLIVDTNTLVVDSTTHCVGIGTPTQPTAPLTLYYDNDDVLNPAILINGGNSGSSQMVIGFFDGSSQQLVSSIRGDRGGSMVLNATGTMYIGYNDLGSFAPEIDLYTVGGKLILDNSGNLSLVGSWDDPSQVITLDSANKTITTWGDITLTGGNFIVTGPAPSTITGDGGMSVIGGPLQTQNLRVMELPVYANNAAAVAGGLTPGDFYRTGTDPDYVCVVH